MYMVACGAFSSKRYYNKSYYTYYTPADRQSAKVRKRRKGISEAR